MQISTVSLVLLRSPLPRLLKRHWGRNGASNRIIHTIVQNRSSIRQWIHLSEIAPATLGDHVAEDDASKFSSRLFGP